MILDGKSLAREIEQTLAARVLACQQRGGIVPALATLLVGDDPASATYVRMKHSACARVGVRSLPIHLPADTAEATLLDEIDRLNRDPGVHGILLQHPVPGHIDERRCFDRIALAKDVDGVTCHGFGRMAMGERAFGSATPAGILRLLDHYRVDVQSKHAVVVGRSPILGRPLALMLLHRNATVTICHSHTTGLPEILRQADIVVGALGKPRYIRGEWIKDGAVVIDAGYHPGGVGDIALDEVIPRASAYTPVPGGVGPMTIASLIEHTVTAAEQSLATAGRDDLAR